VFVVESLILLVNWQEFVTEVDPDIIIGYSICKFDLPYLIEARGTAMDYFYLLILGYSD
jgi:DNA polymerase elongation subunit (family B)